MAQIFERGSFEISQRQIGAASRWNQPDAEYLDRWEGLKTLNHPSTQTAWHLGNSNIATSIWSWQTSRRCFAYVLPHRVHCLCGCRRHPSTTSPSYCCDARSSLNFGRRVGCLYSVAWLMVELGSSPHFLSLWMNRVNKITLFNPGYTFMWPRAERRNEATIASKEVY